MSANPLRIVARFPRPVRPLLVGTLVNKLGTFGTQTKWVYPSVSVIFEGGKVQKVRF